MVILFWLHAIGCDCDWKGSGIVLFLLRIWFCLFWVWNDYDSCFEMIVFLFKKKSQKLKSHVLHISIIKVSPKGLVARLLRFQIEYQFLTVTFNKILTILIHKQLFFRSLIFILAQTFVQKTHKISCK